jgi:putative transposase
LPLFASVRSKNVFVKILDEVRDRYGFLLAGYVVMPEHVHLLISEPARETPSTVMQVLKQRVSRRLRRQTRKRTTAAQLNLLFGRVDHSLPQFRQPRFYDFRVRALLGARRKNVWSQKKFVEKLQYMHLNPLKRKLVAHPKDWPWSSFSFYTNKDPGLVRIDPIT